MLVVCSIPLAMVVIYAVSKMDNSVSEIVINDEMIRVEVETFMDRYFDINPIDELPLEFPLTQTIVTEDGKTIYINVSNINSFNNNTNTNDFNVSSKNKNNNKGCNCGNNYRNINGSVIINICNEDDHDIELPYIPYRVITKTIKSNYYKKSYDKSLWLDLGHSWRNKFSIGNYSKWLPEHATRHVGYHHWGHGYWGRHWK